MLSRANAGHYLRVFHEKRLSARALASGKITVQILGDILQDYTAAVDILHAAEDEQWQAPGASRPAHQSGTPSETPYMRSARVTNNCKIAIMSMPDVNAAVTGKYLAPGATVQAPGSTT